MIQEIRIKNFLSFRDEVCFSFEAKKDNKYEDYNIIEIAEGVRLLRFAMVFGANASGKSNLLNVFKYLTNFWNNKTDSMEDSTDVIPFLLDRTSNNEPSTFKLIFYVGTTKYYYELHLDTKTVLLEKLSVYKSVQPTLLFERKLENNISALTFNSKAIKISNAAKDELELKCLSNMSFFAARKQVNVSLPEIDAPRDWMRKIMPIITPDTKLFKYAEKKIADNQALKDYIIDFVKKADFNISNIKTKVVSKDIPNELLPLFLEQENIPEKEKERLSLEKQINQLETEFQHQVTTENGVEVYGLPSHWQSNGTLRIFGIETAIYNLGQNEGFLAIDEIESSLHPELVEWLLINYLRKKGNRSQLLVTTHNDSMLNSVDDIFRKDSIWFAEKNTQGSTTLYSLADFRGLNRISSIQKAYRNNLFGALPQIES